MPVPHYVSLSLLVGCTIWDAYAQAHGIHYSVPPWLVGAMLAPFGETVYAGVKRLPALLRLPQKK